MSSKSISSVEVVLQKLEYYCSYQERCHLEVQEKLYGFDISTYDKQAVLVHLIEHNFLNEERFASLFSISKFHQKKWGKIRIKNELKARKISDYLISKALKEIPYNEYEPTFETLSEKHHRANKPSLWYGPTCHTTVYNFSFFYFLPNDADHSR